jgi:hypothetical protein
MRGMALAAAIPIVAESLSLRVHISQPRRQNRQLYPVDGSFPSTTLPFVNVI